MDFFKLNIPVRKEHEFARKSMQENGFESPEPTRTKSILIN